MLKKLLIVLALLGCSHEPEPVTMTGDSGAVSEVAAASPSTDAEAFTSQTPVDAEAETPASYEEEHIMRCLNGRDPFVESVTLQEQVNSLATPVVEDKTDPTLLRLRAEHFKAWGMRIGCLDSLEQFINQGERDKKFPVLVKINGVVEEAKAKVREIHLNYARTLAAAVLYPKLFPGEYRYFCPPQSECTWLICNCDEGDRPEMVDELLEVMGDQEFSLSAVNPALTPDILANRKKMGISELIARWKQLPVKKYKNPSTISHKDATQQRICGTYGTFLTAGQRKLLKCPVEE